jgi:hypothetical protein
MDSVGETVESFDYLVTRYGEVRGEYVGNEGKLVDPWDRRS